MFKNLNNKFEKRLSLLSKTQSKDQDIKESLKIFLEKEFGDNLKGFSFIINYNSKDNSLTIDTQNKILASELTIRLGDINEFLKTRNIRLDRILVR